jgi:hypothetical protein
MLTTVRQKPWQKTQLWGLYKTQDGSFLNNTREPLRLKGITDSKLDDWYDPEPFQKIKGDIPMDENFRAGFWPFEDFFVRNFTPEAQLVALEMLAPIGDPRSWTQYLRGKKVLVIHPFDETIRSQFQKRVSTLAENWTRNAL